MKLFCKNNEYKNKKILVYGKGITGENVKNFLKNKGAKVFYFQDGEKQKFKIKKLDLCVISPGIPLETELSKKLKDDDVKIISELELGFQNTEGNLIAITGTNGKTTTCVLLSKILSNSFYVGNAENPLISLWNKSNKNSNVVCEVSSFQLESSKNFKPHISAILNFSPDHLIRHKTFENYVAQKMKIFTNQTKNDFSVFNYDDEKVKECSVGSNAVCFYFSLSNQLENKKFNGVYVSNNQIFYKEGIENVFIMETSNIKLLGNKNLENVLAAVLIAKLCGVSNKIIKERVESFLPLEHRLEFFLDTQKIRYINDSKATNVASALADINSLNEKTVVLFGGSDKGEDFEQLFSKLKDNVVFCVLFGATKEKLESSAKLANYKNYVVAKNLLEATVVAKQFCYDNFPNEKLNLILSPACASFDEFNNYKERGNYFKKIIFNGEKYDKK